MKSEDVLPRSLKVFSCSKCMYRVTQQVVPNLPLTSKQVWEIPAVSPCTQNMVVRKIKIKSFQPRLKRVTDRENKTGYLQLPVFKPDGFK